MERRGTKPHSEVVGKPWGYFWHRRRGQEPCDRCRSAYLAYMRRQHQIRAQATKFVVPRIYWDPAAA